MVMTRLMRAMNDHDIDAFVACFTDDYDSRQPAHPARAFTGKEQVRENWSGIFDSIPDLSADLLLQVSNGLTVVAEWHWKGTQSSGEIFDWRGTTVMGTRDGQVAWGRLYMEPVEAGGLDIEGTVRQMTGN